jgi:hypothetical protein
MKGHSRLSAFFIAKEFFCLSKIIIAIPLESGLWWIGVVLGIRGFLIVPANASKNE